MAATYAERSVTILTAMLDNIGKPVNEDAREVFDGMAERDCDLWNVMMDGCIKDRDMDGAVR